MTLRALRLLTVTGVLIVRASASTRVVCVRSGSFEF
jgi:hypothetical protein